MASVIPAQGSRSLRLNNAANSLSQSATLQGVLGVNSPADALVRIHEDIGADDGTMPRPRVMFRHFKSVNADVNGNDSFFSAGQMLAFLQVDVPSDAAMIATYELPEDTVLTEEDRRRHLNNIMGQITDDLVKVAKTAGCLEIHRWEEFSCGLADPTAEQGTDPDPAPFWEIVWVAHYEGQL